MKDRKDIEQLAEQALYSLDSLQQLEANDFLAAKAWQRMQTYRHSVPPVYNKLLFKLAVVLVMFVGINFVSFYMLTKPTKTNTETVSGVDAFASAYGLGNTSDNY